MTAPRFITLNDVYALKGTPQDLREWVLRERWFPEVPNLAYDMTTELLETLQAEGRLRVVQLAAPYIDGNRVAELHTLWFDNAPFAVVQDAGRSGDDHRQRWVTDATAYAAALQYLLQHLVLGARTEDLVSPEAPFYPEEVLNFYGHDFATQLGFAPEPRDAQYQFLGESGQFLNRAGNGLMLVLFAGKTPPADFIRRGGTVMRFEREPNEAEIAVNPRLATGPDDGGQRCFWYRVCERPAEATVVSI